MKENPTPAGTPKTPRFGLFLTNQHPLDTDLSRAMEDQLVMVRFARDHGWDSIWGGQHYLVEGMTMMQPAPFLARLSADAGEMTVGLGIMLLALQNPVYAAETVASLDAVCGGRFVFGVGLGYRDVEYDAFGVSRGERVWRFEQNLETTMRLLRGDVVTVDLPWCRLDNAQLTTRPVQQPTPPLWMAANNDRAVRRAARTADTWFINPHATFATISRQLELFHAERGAADLAPPAELPAAKEVFCAPTRAAALDMAQPYLAEKYRAYAKWGQDKALPGRESFDVSFGELERGRFVLGSPDDCLRQLLPWREQLGVDHFIFRTTWSGLPFQDALTSMRLLTEEVIPVLRKAAPRAAQERACQPRK